MRTPAPLPPPAPNGHRARNAYLRGLAFGSIPLIIFSIFGGVAGILQRNGPNPYSYAGAAPLVLGLISGAAGLVLVLFSAIVAISSRNSRPFGYGLLTMVFVSPVVAAGSCQIYLRILSAIPQ